MYEPPLFREDDPAALHGLIRDNPLGLLITGGAAGLVANPIPFLLDPAAGPQGTLRCHVARANPQWRAVYGGCEALVVFQASQHYVHPGWYATKRETGKVVPTWNYAMVQVSGTARAITDEHWLARQIRDLTAMMEGSYPDPWAVDDAPPDFIAGQIRGIVGIEIAITAIRGKWKVSQNRSDADRDGVIAGLEALATAPARAMSDLVRNKRKTGG